MQARAQAHGYTLVELATVLVILGVLTMGMHSALESMQQARLHNAALAHAENARQALRAYLLRNKRLPCPDTTPEGDLGRSASPCNANAGWLPYETLGLETPERARRLRYGVHRSAGIDLVDPAPSSIDEPDLEGRSGLAAQLMALAVAPPEAGAPHYAEDFLDLGDVCSGAELANPGFVLVAPAADLDGAGGAWPGFDGPNRGFAAGTSLCVAAPSRPANANYDDVVVAESAASLLGWLTASTR